MFVAANSNELAALVESLESSEAFQTVILAIH
jgi:hypothetical protein